MPDDNIHFRSLSVDFSPQKTEFKPRSIHVGFVVGKVMLERGFLRVVYLGGVDGRIILIWILKNWDGGGHGLERCGSEMAGFCERGNEPSGSIKCGEFLD
jgi:hypothetical protein